MDIENKLAKIFSFIKLPYYIQVYIVKLFFGITRMITLPNFSFKDCLKMFNPSSQYKIEGTKNLDMHPCYGSKLTYPNFQEELEDYKNKLTHFVNNSRCLTIYKFGDGDYHFLKKQEFGSANPGKRALSKSYNEINHQEFIDGVLKNDFISVEIYPENRKMFLELFPDGKIYCPAEYGYGLVANKWFFNEFQGKIGLIGGKEKLELIEQLMHYSEYQDYLGLSHFNDYIYIPQKYACDDISVVEIDISRQLKASSSSIFLLGIGHVKSALLHRLKKYHNAVYLDVGSGLDSIAGCINIRRPYAGDWTNYRIKTYDYSKIDYLQYFGIGRQVILK